MGKNITHHKIFTDLLPVIRNRDMFQLEDAKQTVKNFLLEKVYYTDRDMDFLCRFKNGYYRPELLFDNQAAHTRDFSRELAASFLQ